MAANATYNVPGHAIGGFLAATSGTITITAKEPNGINTNTYVNAVPVIAGVYLPIPLEFPTAAGGTVTLASGASGTLFV
jgi:hypothetical protein